MISESSFIRKHLSRATLGQKRVVINDDYPCQYFPIQSVFSCALSSISDQLINDETNLVPPFRANVKCRELSGVNVRRCHIVCPFRAEVELKAFCEELWCVNVEESLYLWNPSTGTHKRLHDPPGVVSSSSCIISSAASVEAVYGLGYDGVNDDFKLLRVWRIHKYIQGTLLYSLRSDSLKDTHQCFPGKFPHSNGVFVNGAFHWMILQHGHVLRNRIERYHVGHYRNVYEVVLSSITIVSFDLSTEMYKEVPQPMYSPRPNVNDNMDVGVLRDMLCVFLNYKEDNAFVLWVMTDYGVEESWTKIYDFRFNSIPYIQQKISTGKLITLTPLYLYEDGGVLIWMFASYKDWEMFIYKSDQVIARREIVASGSKNIPVGCRSSKVRAGFVYVESLISPAAWPQFEVPT